MSEREELLERLLSGDVGDGDPAARRLLENDPSARQELEALRALEGSLGRQGDRTRVLLQAASELDVRDGGPLVRRELGRLSGATARPEPRWRRVWLIWTAAAAAAVLAVLLWRLGPEDRAPAEELLLSDTSSQAVSPLEPVGEVASFATFRWTGTLQSGGWFQVEVYDASAPLGSEPFLRSGSLLASHWTPQPTLTQWPPEIRWLVLTFDAAGHGRSSESFSASLAP